MEPHLFRIKPEAGAGNPTNTKARNFFFTFYAVNLKFWLDGSEHYVLPAIGDSLYFLRARRRTAGGIPGRTEPGFCGSIRRQHFRQFLKRFLLLCFVNSLRGANEAPNRCSLLLVASGSSAARGRRERSIQGPGRRPRPSSCTARFTLSTRNSRGPRPWPFAWEKIIAVGTDAEVERPPRRRYESHRRPEANWFSPALSIATFISWKARLAWTGSTSKAQKMSLTSRRILRDYAGKTPGDGWILGSGWNYAMFGHRKASPQKISRRTFPESPRIHLRLRRSHPLGPIRRLLNSPESPPTPPNPANGIIVRDLETREATGGPQRIRRPSGRQSRSRRHARPAKLKPWATDCTGPIKNGLTRVHSAGGDFPELELYDELRRHGALTVRMYNRLFPESAPNSARKTSTLLKRPAKIYGRLAGRRSRKNDARRGRRIAHRRLARTLCR